MKLGARDRLAVVTGECAGERSGGSAVSMGGNGGMAGAGERLRWLAAGRRSASLPRAGPEGVRTGAGLRDR